jgi:uncharacterized protein YkwD
MRTSLIKFCLVLASVLTANIGQAADAEFTNDALQAHNRYRADHGAPPLTINQKVNLQRKNSLF